MVVKHIVAHSNAVWGAYKPFAALAVRILQSRTNVHFTVLIQGGMLYTKFMRELAKIPLDQLKKMRPYLHVIDLTGKETSLDEDLSEELFVAFDALHNSRAVTCKSTGTTIQGLVPPSVAILDLFSNTQVDIVRSIAGSSCAIFSWMTFPAGAALYRYGPKKYGGRDDMYVEVDDEVRRTRKVEAEVANRVRQDSRRGRDPLCGDFITGKVVNIPGISPMYDYEWSPQELESEDFSFYITAQRNMRKIDGTICGSSSVYEPEAMAACKEWATSIGQAWYAIGPLSLPDSFPSTQAHDDKERSVLSFLNKMQCEFGDRSVLFISFGTLYWPTRPEKLWGIIDELLSARKPFIFACTSPLAHIPKEKEKIISESGISMMMSWLPQEKVLSHPATGWFVTHGGWNSTQEALIHRVPVIYWPFGFDQPYNTIRTCQLNAGFELVEVRTGKLGTRVPYRFKDGPYFPSFTVSAAREEFRMLLQRIEGEEGRVVRANFERLGKMVDETLNDGQEGKENLEAFLRRFVD
ncbi:hypothetical protein D9757_010229 [Collybiopsis confluens]|uniref:Glycosyltransferase family 1 protein n=1 Tax=Collybiopsis confluens TaxID=2823264 RepID=A0A8H5GPG1_9AGAR|nr:hypothetical protein D9757_010229 [Collybiopsis confluens]